MIWAEISVFLAGKVVIGSIASWNKIGLGICGIRVGFKLCLCGFVLVGGGCSICNFEGLCLNCSPYYS